MPKRVRARQAFGLSVVICISLHLQPSLTTTMAQNAAQDPNQAALQKHARLAGEAMQRLDYASAEREYLAILRLVPNVAEVQSNLGLACYLQGKLESAAKHFHGALKLKPSLYAPNYFLGRIRYKQGRFGESLPFLEHAVKVEPENIEACRQLASAHVALKAVGRAIALYRTCLKKDPRQMEVLYDLGVVYMNLAGQSFDRVAELPSSAFSSLIKASHYANLDESGLSERGAWIKVVRNEYHTAIQKAPRLPEIRATLGSLELREGNWDVAEELFEKELELDPSSYLARYGLAEVFLQRKELGKALNYLNDAAKIRPEFFDPPPEFLIALPKQDLNQLYSIMLKEHLDGSFGSAFLQGVVEAQLSRDPIQSSALQAAEERLLTLKQRVTTTVTTQMPAGQAKQEGLKLLREKRYEAGTRLLLSVARKSDPESDLLLPLARALVWLKEYDVVGEILDPYASRHAEDPEPHYLLGISYQAAANEIMQTMLSTDPHSFRLRMLMGDAFFARERYEEAIKEYLAALEMQPTNSDLHLRLGRVYQRQTKYEEALNHFRRSVESDPLNAQAQLRLGDSLLMAQKAEEAVPHLTAALDLDFSLLDAHAKLGKALSLLGRLEEAVSHLEVASKLDRDGSLHYQLATLYRRLGKEDQAASNLKESQRLRAQDLKEQELRTMEQQGGATGRDNQTGR